jgi:hypothetical protein
MVEELEGGWQTHPIRAGLWVSRHGRIPSPVLGLAAEPDRVTVVVDAEGPDSETDQAVREVFAKLSTGGQSAVRLALPGGASRYGPAGSRAYGLDLIAAEGPLIVTPHAYALAAPADPGPGEQPQWRRFLPGGGTIPAGLLGPSPAWEQELTASAPDRVGPGVAVHRVRSGLALLTGHGAGSGQLAAAHRVWPDPERMTVVADGSGAQREVLSDALTALLLALPAAAAPSVRLWWPRAGADPNDPGLHEIARECGVGLVAPSADLALVSACCGLCHGPGGAAPWFRFTGHPPAQPMEPLYPAPGWQRALGEADLASLPPGLSADRVPAGLAVYREEPGDRGQPYRGLSATAHSVIPDPERACVISGGTAQSPAARQDLEAVLERLPREATRRLRIVLSGAGVAAGSEPCYAQVLAEKLRSDIIAPTGAWTATPDGRLRAAAAGAGGWQEFRPGRKPRAYPAPSDPAVPPGPAASSGPAPSDPVVPPGQATPSDQVESSDAEDTPGQADPAAAPVVTTPPPTAAVPPAEAPSLPDLESSSPRPVSTYSPVGRPAPDRTAPGTPISDYPISQERPAPDPTPPDTPISDYPKSQERPAPDRTASAPSLGAAAMVDHAAPSPASAGEDPGRALPRRVVPPSRDPGSLAEDRKLYRESAPAFHHHAVAVRRILSQRPGLRAAAGPEEGVLVDFAALLDLLASYRLPGDTGEQTEPWEQARLACAEHGLRRLPSFRGPVYYPANLPVPAADAYRTGHVLVEPAFVMATSSPAVSCDRDGDFVIWSETGKRVAALAERSRPDEVMFAPGSSFKVLSVDSGREAPRIYLRELPEVYLRAGQGQQAGADGAPAGSRWDVMDMRVLDQLGTAAAVRDGTPPDHDTVSPWGRAVPPLGLDDQGAVLSR